MPLVILLVVAIAALASILMLACRYEQSRRGAGIARIPDSGPHPAAVSDSKRLVEEVSYTCIDAPGVEVSSSVAWDDGWFLRDADAGAYNHELARTCAVLSALAYAESSHYQKSYQTPPYMERALGSLGFAEVSTESYRYRSEVVDQVLNLVTRQEDTVAYTVARKRVMGEGGIARSVVVVSVRGSYGSEWLSNLRLENEEDVLRIARQYDHAGYVAAADEISEALAPWIEESHRRGEGVSLLLTGHSRGGAIADLVAARADDELAGFPEGRSGFPLGLLPGDSVAGYTFASPACTTASDAHADRFRNIFNIVNPADPVPRLPLASWGYARYGSDLLLPSCDDAAFGRRYAAMKARYAELTSMQSGDPYDPAAARAVAAAEDEMASRLASPSAIATPSGVAAVVQACARHIDPSRILCGHYPSVYIGWMYATAGEDLRREH